MGFSITYHWSHQQRRYSLIICQILRHWPWESDSLLTGFWVRFQHWNRFRRKVIRVCELVRLRVFSWKQEDDFVDLSIQKTDALEANGLLHRFSSRRYPQGHYHWQDKNNKGKVKQEGTECEVGVWDKQVGEGHPILSNILILFTCSLI